MSASVTVRGFLGSAETRQVGDKSVQNGTVAVSVRKYNRESKQNEYETDWYRFEFWEGSYTNAGNAGLNKGDFVQIEGQLIMETYNEKTTPRIKANAVLLLKSPKSSARVENETDTVPVAKSSSRSSKKAVADFDEVPF